MPLIKTALIGVGCASLLGIGLLAWQPASSYFRTGLRSAGEAAHKMVPTTFEIERIETLVHDLESVVGRQEAKLVEQRLDLEYLQKDLQRCESEVDRLSREVGEARKVLSVHRASYRIGGNTYDRPMVVREATNKAERLVRAREIAEAKRRTAETLAAALSQAEAQLAEARNQRETYRLRLAELDAKAENVAIRKELAVRLDHLPAALDDGAFQEVEAAFSRVEKDLAVQDRLLEERYRHLPQQEAIEFSARPSQDVLAMLDAALDQPPLEPTGIDSQPAPVRLEEAGPATLTALPQDAGKTSDRL